MCRPDLKSMETTRLIVWRGLQLLKELVCHTRPIHLRENVKVQVEKCMWVCLTLQLLLLWGFRLSCRQIVPCLIFFKRYYLLCSLSSLFKKIFNFFLEFFSSQAGSRESVRFGAAESSRGKSPYRCGGCPKGSRCRSCRITGGKIACRKTLPGCLGFAYGGTAVSKHCTRHRGYCALELGGEWAKGGKNGTRVGGHPWCNLV